MCEYFKQIINSGIKHTKIHIHNLTSITCNNGISVLICTKMPVSLFFLGMPCAPVPNIMELYFEYDKF